MNENETHEEFLEAVKNGHAIILDDGDFPGGRFQTGVHTMGGDLIIQVWQCKDGDWNQRNGVILHKDAPSKLLSFLYKTGYLETS